MSSDVLIHTSAISPVFAVSVALCEFTMLPVVHILLSHHKEKMHSFVDGTDTCIRYILLITHSSKRCNPLTAILLLCPGLTSKKLRLNCFFTGPLCVEF